MGIKNKLTGILLLILSLAACTTPQGEGVRLRVILKMPTGLSQFSLTGAEVKLINAANGSVYTTFANEEGMASFDAEYGIYRLTAQLTCHDNNFTHLLNAGRENIRLIPHSLLDSDTLSVSLTDSPLSNIIINEIYYSGCYEDNGRQYLKDSYISLYNNSDNMVYLDSLCLGIAGPVVAGKISPWLSYNPGLIPIAYIGWQFPGNGQDYPLAPGQETVIAINAVNHQGDKYNHPNSVDLSKAEWAFYHTSLTGSDIAPGVTPMEMFIKLSPLTTYTLSLTGPGVVLYKIKGMTAGDYAAIPDHLMAEPPKFTGLKYLMIPADEIIDCVDCVENATKQGFKRFPSFLDAEATFLPSGKYSGRSLRRKMINNRNGRMIYQDTNNSASDFEEKIPLMRKEY